MVIHPLAQGRFRRNLLKTQGFTEKVIVTVLLDGCKIALPCASIAQKDRITSAWEMPSDSGTAWVMDGASFVKRFRASPISEMPEVEV